MYKACRVGPNYWPRRWAKAVEMVLQVLRSCDEETGLLDTSNDVGLSGGAIPPAGRESRVVPPGLRLLITHGVRNLERERLDGGFDVVAPTGLHLQVLLRVIPLG